MPAYIKKRLLGFFVVMAGVSILSFLLIAVSNADPAEVIARHSAGGATEEMIGAIRIQLGLDKPFCVRYIKWLGGLITGNLGVSVFSFRPISQDLAAYFPTTLRMETAIKNLGVYNGSYGKLSSIIASMDAPDDKTFVMRMRAF